MKYGLIFLLLFLCCQVHLAQKDNKTTQFGLHIRPVFPTRFIGEPELVLSQDGFNTTIQQKMGLSFGGIIRWEYTKFLGLETGINFTQRNFNLSMSVPDSNVAATNDLSFIAYDLPINLLVFVQMTDNIFANASFGIAAAFKPTNVGVLTLPGGAHSFTHTGRLYSKATLEFNANIGVEWRTKKSGRFYLGGSGRLPFKPVFEMVAQYKYQGYKNTIRSGVDGSFLALDIKYFFPNISNKGMQFKEGPIR